MTERRLKHKDFYLATREVETVILVSDTLKKQQNKLFFCLYFVTVGVLKLTHAVTWFPASNSSIVSLRLLILYSDNSQLLKLFHCSFISVLHRN